MGLAETILLGLCLNVTCQKKEIPNISLSSDGYGKTLIFSELENQLKGQHLKIATIQNGELSYAIKYNNTWIGRGIAFKLMKILQEKYEFTYTVILPKHNSLGNRSSGIFGLLYNNEADVAVAFLPITAVYWGYAQFATALGVGEWVVVLKRPPASATGSGVTAPFTLNVWILILISLVTIGPTIYLITSFQTKLTKKNTVKPISILECVWFTYGALLKQGTTLSPKSDSLRLAFATWWIFITVLTAFYTANLTAFLTLSEFTLPIKDPTDIAAKRLSWVSESGSVIEEVANNNLEELYNVLKGTQSKFVEESNDEILRTWVTQNNYLYISERSNVDILIYRDYLNKSNLRVPEEKRCTYAVTPWAIFKRVHSFAYSKEFRFGPLFDATLRNLVESGLVKKFLTWKLPKAKVCPLNLGNKERRLKNRDLLLTYYIVGIGFGIAICVFVVEIVVSLLTRTRYKSRKVIAKKHLNIEHDMPRPPPYNALLFHSLSNKLKTKRVIVNGRDYWVVKLSDGSGTRLIPVRAPSALLFQYTN